MNPSSVASAMFLLLVVIATMAAADDKIPVDLVKVVNRMRAIVRGKGEEAIYEEGEKHKGLNFKGAPTATDQVSEKEEQKNEAVASEVDKKIPQRKQETPLSKEDVPPTTDTVHATAQAEGQKGEQEDKAEPAVIVGPQGMEVAEELGLGDYYLLSGREICPVEHLIKNEADCLDAGNLLTGWDKDSVVKGTWPWDRNNQTPSYSNRYAPCGCFLWRDTNIQLNEFRPTSECIGVPSDTSISVGQSVCTNCVEVPTQWATPGIIPNWGRCQDANYQHYNSQNVFGDRDYSDSISNEECAVWCKDFSEAQGCGIPLLRGFEVWSRHTAGGPVSGPNWMCRCLYDSDVGMPNNGETRVTGQPGTGPVEHTGSDTTTRLYFTVFCGKFID